MYCNGPVEGKENMRRLDHLSGSDVGKLTLVCSRIMGRAERRGLVGSSAKPFPRVSTLSLEI